MAGSFPSVLLDSPTKDSSNGGARNNSNHAIVSGPTVMMKFAKSGTPEV